MEARTELSHYDDVLQELREKGQMLANKYIVELYNILRDEEKLLPRDCRARIEHDCLDLWSKATIRKYLPDEAKNSFKQKAGKMGGEAKKTMVVVASTKNGARINLVENNSVSQNEQESDAFHNDINQNLSARTLPPELVEVHKINAEKDRKIEELKYELKRITIEGGFKVHRAPIDYVISKATEIRENNKKKDYLYIITQGSDVLDIVDHMPQSDEEIQELFG
jgi:hypothetical protein